MRKKLKDYGLSISTHKGRKTLYVPTWETCVPGLIATRPIVPVAAGSTHCYLGWHVTHKASGHVVTRRRAKTLAGADKLARAIADNSPVDWTGSEREVKDDFSPTEEFVQAVNAAADMGPLRITVPYRYGK